MADLHIHPASRIVYALFLAIVFALYWGLPFPRLRPYILIASGVVFYTNYFPPHIVLILGLTIFTFVIGEMIRRRVGHARRPGGAEKSRHACAAG